MSGPVQVLWEAAGAVVPDLPFSRAGVRVCAGCRRSVDQVVRVADVVSAQFTGWDQLTVTAVAQPVWCVPCAWSHSLALLRTQPLLASLTDPASSGPLALHLVGVALRAGAVDEQVAFTVPLSRKKHVAPSMRWGTVATDDRVLDWSSRDARLLGRVGWLRGLGFPEGALTEAAPPWMFFGKVPNAEKGAVLEAWADLELWRRDPVRLAIAVRVLRNPKAPVAEPHGGAA